MSKYCKDTQMTIQTNQTYFAVQYILEYDFLLVDHMKYLFVNIVPGIQTQ